MKFGWLLLEYGQSVWLSGFWARIFSRRNCSTTVPLPRTHLYKHTVAQRLHFWLIQQAVVQQTVKSLGSSLFSVPCSCPVLPWPLPQIPSEQELKHARDRVCVSRLWERRGCSFWLCLVQQEKKTQQKPKETKKPQNQTKAVPHLVISDGTASSTLPSGQDMTI